jgi:hypothetical protein
MTIWVETGGGGGWVSLFSQCVLSAASQLLFWIEESRTRNKTVRHAKIFVDHTVKDCINTTDVC